MFWILIFLVVKIFWILLFQVFLNFLDFFFGFSTVNFLDSMLKKKKVFFFLNSEFSEFYELYLYIYIYITLNFLHFLNFLTFLNFMSSQFSEFFECLNLKKYGCYFFAFSGVFFSFSEFSGFFFFCFYNFSGFYFY